MYPAAREKIGPTVTPTSANDLHATANHRGRCSRGRCDYVDYTCFDCLGRYFAPPNLRRFDVHERTESGGSCGLANAEPREMYGAEACDGVR